MRTKSTYLLRGALQNATTGYKSFGDLLTTPCPSFKGSSATITTTSTRYISNATLSSIWPSLCLGRPFFQRGRAISLTSGRITRRLSLPACVSTSPTSPFSESQPKMRVKTQSSGPAGRKVMTRLMWSSPWMKITAVKRQQRWLSITKATQLCSRLFKMPYGIPTLRGTPQSYGAWPGTCARRTLLKRIGLLSNATRAFTSKFAVTKTVPYANIRVYPETMFKPRQRPRTCCISECWMRLKVAPKALCTPRVTPT
ncbi:hypothetical protein BGZ61DRAFT_463755 [Ilyonectria robusta]|uniref:uncharacterized protein n=1 Tax=Ilyonectria robusta TaxID=1079257 RepID=UPI001E8EF08C|nr:uncharacterized protein BGZ61DRAFT_463755 [Ilyonectria robusta]KAH8661831.1 hypothetical protein BGZ61DRAFT_463755 [Ilyonectria robusta]